MAHSELCLCLSLPLISLSLSLSLPLSLSLSLSLTTHTHIHTFLRAEAMHKHTHLCAPTHSLDCNALYSLGSPRHCQHEAGGEDGVVGGCIGRGLQAWDKRQHLTMLIGPSMAVGYAGGWGGCSRTWLLACTRARLGALLRPLSLSEELHKACWRDACRQRACWHMRTWLLARLPAHLSAHKCKLPTSFAS